MCDIRALTGPHSTSIWLMTSTVALRHSMSEAQLCTGVGFGAGGVNLKDRTDISKVCEFANLLLAKHTTDNSTGGNFWRQRRRHLFFGIRM